MKYIVPRDGSDLRIYEFEKDPYEEKMNNFYCGKEYDYKNIVFQLLEF
jgi:hypothetical protein